MAISIREVGREEEFLDIARLQKEIWGFAAADVAAPHLIMLHQQLGGVVLGAFEGEEMIAFCYSFFGMIDGEGTEKVPIHWSHMLAVQPQYRGTGLGKQLKWRQREMILERGVRICRWTYDPLETLNARLNIITLGCKSSEYIFNAYGASTGHLHAGLTTDRFVAHWVLDSERAVSCAGGKPLRTGVEIGSLPFALRAVEEADSGVLIPGEPADCGEAEYLGAEIPTGMQDMKVNHREAAVSWREATAGLFPGLFERGYVLVDVLSPKESGRPTAVYVLHREGNK